ncbi:MAG: electron transfer flavoprotein subunit beta/FixA family protein [Deltaproteobacteria bacterium]|jgi:electron transfer flavoprotein beta subunit|nr:electron transfer flavoprotein subunit beta/FixA family protein [Deltaproteobacteria bacterium]
MSNNQKNNEALRIAVAIKQVPPGLGGTTDAEKGYVLRTSPGRLNPFDAPALELALRLKDKYRVKVDLFSMGPLQAEKTLKEAMSLGPDRAFHLCDPAFSGSDSLATSRTLIRAMDLEGPYDLIICGLATTDGGTGQVGPGLAALLQCPFVGRISEVISLETPFLKVKQLYSDELLETQVTLPVVVSVIREGFTLRLPSVKARLKPRLITKLTLADLIGDDTQEAAYFGEKGSPTKILKTKKPDQPQKILARPRPASAASVIIEAARKAKL